MTTDVQEKKPIVDELFKAGVHFGYSKSRRHPSTSSYVYATKNKTDILNLEMAAESLEKACKFVFELGKQGKQIIFVGTKPEARQAIREMADSLDQPNVTERWVGGSLTNFPEIKKRITRLLDLRAQKESGEFEKYTKKERLMLDREIDDMTKNFDGLTGLKKADAMFIVDVKSEDIARSEADKVGMPIITLSNSDCDIRNIAYPIVGNDATISSIRLIVEQIASAYRQGRSDE